MTKDSSCPLGIFSYFGYDLPLRQRIELIKSAGFGSTFIWWGEKEKAFRGGMRHRMPNTVRDAGLILESIHVPYEDCNDLWSDSASARENIVKQHISWLSDCAKHEIPTMVMHVTRGTDHDLSDRHGINSIERILGVAEDLSVTLAIENTRQTELVDFILSEIESQYLGFCYDSSHDWLYSDNPTRILEKWGGRLVALHLSDNDGVEDRHWLPHEGVIDWESLAKVFPRETFSGCLTLEVVPREGTTDLPEAFLAKAYERISRIGKLLTGCEASDGI